MLCLFVLGILLVLVHHWIHFLFVTGCPVDILIDLSEPAASVIDEDQEDKENTAPFTATGKYAKTETKPS